MEAVEEYKRVVALDNKNFLGFSSMGTANLLAGNFEAAASALERAIELEPRPNSYSNLGLMHYYLGRLDEAIETHRKAVELAPGDHLYWSNLGDALWNAGDRNEAILVFETAEDLVAQAAAVNPNDPDNLMDLAWISAMLEKSDVALTLVNRARLLSPDDPYVHYIHGLVLLRRGDTDAALTALGLAAEKGYSVQMMGAEPHLAELAEDPRFHDILQTGL